MRYCFAILTLLILIQSCRQKQNVPENPDLNKNTTPIGSVKKVKTPLKAGWDISVIEEIDSADFYRQMKIVNTEDEKYRAVTDRKLAGEILKGIVTLCIIDDNGKLISSDTGWLVSKIRPRRGEILNFKEYDAPVFIAYYPELDILLCEGGHTSDLSYNLTTGLLTEDVGNPEIIVTSKSKKMRLNGYYDGQECYRYFIQTKTGSCYTRIIPLYDVFRQRMQGATICNISNAFWFNDEELCVEEAVTAPKRYYRIKVSK